MNRIQKLEAEIRKLNKQEADKKRQNINISLESVFTWRILLTKKSQR